MSDDAPEDEYDLLPPIGKRQRFRTYSRKQCKAEKLALLSELISRITNHEYPGWLSPEAVDYIVYEIEKYCQELEGEQE